MIELYSLLKSDLMTWVGTQEDRGRDSKLGNLNVKILSSESRLFIVQLVKNYLHDGMFCSAVRGLVASCDANDRAVKEGLEFLKQQGFITEYEINLKADKKASAMYRFTDSFTQLLVNSKSQPSERLKPLIEVILFPSGGYNPKKEYKIRFSRSDRLLLAVMLHNADSKGVLNNLSFSELSSITGMSVRRVKGKICDFVNEKILHASISGMANRSLFGMVKSVHVLNLRHSLYGYYVASGYRMSIVYHATDNNHGVAAQRIYRLARDNNKLKQRGKAKVAINLQSLAINDECFLDAKDHDIKIYLQHTLESYATRFLNAEGTEAFKKEWSFYKLGESNSYSSEFGDLKDEIAKTLYHKKVYKGDVRSIAEYMLYESFMMARCVQEPIAKVFNFSYEDDCFLILPADFSIKSVGVHFSVEVFTSQIVDETEKLEDEHLNSGILHSIKCVKF